MLIQEKYKAGFLALLISSALSGCSFDGDDGAPGIQGEQGEQGEAGNDGEDASQGVALTVVGRAVVGGQGAGRNCPIPWRYANNLCHKR